MKAMNMWRRELLNWQNAQNIIVTLLPALTFHVILKKLDESKQTGKLVGSFRTIKVSSGPYEIYQLFFKWAANEKNFKVTHAVFWKFFITNNMKENSKFEGISLLWWTVLCSPKKFQAVRPGWTSKLIKDKRQPHPHVPNDVGWLFKNMKRA